MPSQNPFIDAQSDLYDAIEARRRAEMDLDRAKFQESIASRTAIPNAVAAWRANQAKAQKAKQNAQTASGKAAADAQMAAQNPSFLPPMTPVNGQVTSGTTQALAGAGADILRQITGGAALKQAGVPGANAGGGGTPMQLGGISAVYGQQLPPGGTNVPAQQASPITVTPTGIPGVGQATQNLTGWERAGSGAATLLDLIARRGQAITDIQEAVSGQRNLGNITIPTATEIAAPHAQGLAELELLRTRSTEPGIASQAQQARDQQLAQIRQLAIRSGVDPDEAVAESINLSTAMGLKLTREEQEKQDAREYRTQQQKDLQAQRHKDALEQAGLTSKLIEGRQIREGQRAEERQIRQEKRAAGTSEGQLRARTADAGLRYATNGWNSLSPEDRALLPPAVRKAEQESRAPVISQAERSRAEQQITEDRNNQSMADDLLAHWHPEEYTALGAGAKAFKYNLQERAHQGGFPVDPLTQDQQVFLSNYKSHDFALSNIRASMVRSLAGANIGPVEAELYLKAIPDEGDALSIATQKVGQFKELWGLKTLRDELSLEMGFPQEAGTPIALQTPEGEPVLAMGNMRRLAGQFAEISLNQLIEHGWERVAAKKRVEEIFRNRFGLDPNKYITGDQPGQ